MPRRRADVRPSSQFSRALSKNVAELLASDPERLRWTQVRWEQWCSDQGLNLRRTFDWNMFWSAAAMKYIVSAPEDTFQWGIRLLRGFQKEVPLPAIKRSDKLMQHFSKEQLEAMLIGLEALLNTTAAECDAAGKDYPSWYQETKDVLTSVERALNPPVPVQPIVETATARTSLGSGGKRRV